MRTLFLSEKRCISNLIKEKWGETMRSEPYVLKEYLAGPSSVGKQPNFNCDFSLDFVEDFTEWRERQGTMNTALPNTVGTDLYLFVESSMLTPLHFELMFGEAFSIKYYATYIERVEKAVREAIFRRKRIGALSAQALLRIVPLANSASARVLVVRGDVCFLYFPSDSIPVMRGLRFDLVESDDCHIACYLDGEEVVCFDGWISTDVARSDQVLVAEQEEKP